MNKKIGFIGVGNMGLPMALNLINAGFDVTVYDKNPGRIQSIASISSNIKIATKPSEVVSSQGTLLTMVTDDAAILDIFLGENGIIELLNEKHTHLLMSTVAPKTVVEINRAHTKNGTSLVVAPVLGRPEAAESKKLWILLSGHNKAKDEIYPILEQLGQGVYDFGENIISSCVVKLAVNFLILSAIETMGESMAFIQKNDLNSELFAKLITETLFDCVAYNYHAHNVASKNFTPAGFKLFLGLKDIDLLTEVSHNLNVPMPIASLLKDKLLRAMAKGRNELDWGAISLDCFEDAGLS